MTFYKRSLSTSVVVASTEMIVTFPVTILSPFFKDRMFFKPFKKWPSDWRREKCVVVCV